ncbi:DUF4136 domain-containing protein [Spirosoma radiotolerans]|uniref:DUF4136 domain-containing protein n=1 Tax=Spirosoma radiotolerans TaxID=1379870 RepID=A0A0E3ZUF2_9BACT|nr:DUF4136 domain-containing protein [Spirosoma radiotolerans]AKD54518.1 hypothetical protein SD10_05940 [Spirosoma radiotolerans]
MKTVVALLLVLISVVAGCSSYRIVKNEQDGSANWSTYRTFAFIDTSRIDPSPGTTYQAMMEQVKRAVAVELVNRGYQQVTGDPIAGQPDLLVNIGTVVNEKTQTRPTTIYEAPRYIGQRRYHWQSQEVPVGTYREGTLSLHIVDSRRENLLWDAAVSSILSKKGVTPEQINEAVAKVFSKFPGKAS